MSSKEHATEGMIVRTGTNFLCSTCTSLCRGEWRQRHYERGNLGDIDSSSSENELHRSSGVTDDQDNEHDYEHGYPTEADLDRYLRESLE